MEVPPRSTGRLDARSHVRIEAVGVVEVLEQGRDVDPGLQEPADVVEVVGDRHVHDAVRLGGEDVVDLSSRGDAGRADAAQLAGVAAGLLIRVHVHADEVERRVLDQRSQRGHPAVTRPPLGDPVALVSHRSPRSAHGAVERCLGDLLGDPGPPNSSSDELYSALDEAATGSREEGPSETGEAQRQARARGRPRGVQTPTTRDALLAAAETLMLEEGYAAVSSRRVAAKAGTDAALVYYYFGTMDDLFIALFRWGERRTHERHTDALASAQPLWALWDAIRDPSSSVLTTEFIALGNHRKAIRAELAGAATKSRQMQLERLSGVLESYGVDPKTWPPGAIILMLWGISLYLRTEEAFGVDICHAETVELVERHIRALEGDRASSSTTARSRSLPFGAPEQ